MPIECGTTCRISIGISSVVILIAIIYFIYYKYKDNQRKRDEDHMRRCSLYSYVEGANGPEVVSR